MNTYLRTYPKEHTNASTHKWLIPQYIYSYVANTTVYIHIYIEAMQMSISQLTI